MTSFQEMRKYRIFNLTIIDLVPTLVIAYFVHLWLWTHPLELNNKDKRSWIQYFISLTIIIIMFLGIGMIFHRMFGIKSALSGYLGLNRPVIKSL
jgi:hypothetical protein